LRGRKDKRPRAADIGPKRRAGAVDADGRSVWKRRRKSDAAKLVAGRRQIAPLRRRRKRHRLSAESFAQCHNQLMLLAATLQLPDTEPDQHTKRPEREYAHPDRERSTRAE